MRGRCSNEYFIFKWPPDFFVCYFQMLSIIFHTRMTKSKGVWILPFTEQTSWNIFQIQSESDNRTSSVIEPSILPITRRAIAIWYMDPDIGPYREAIYVRISRFSGYQASGYWTPTESDNTLGQTCIVDLVWSHACS
jgi:hypothetical protein